MTTMNMTRPAQATARPHARNHDAMTLGTQLTPRTVAAWEARLGIERQRMSRPDRFIGSAGVAEWNADIEVTSHDPEQFRAVRYSRELSMMGTFCALHSAVRMERTAESIKTNPSELLLVTVTSMRGKSVVRQAGQEHAYGAGDLLFVSTSTQFQLTTAAVSDPSGLVIPLALLGKHRFVAEQPRRPINSRTPLSRAAAGFVRRFAADTAASDFPAPSGDTELAAIDLVTAALAELASDDRYVLQDDSLFNHQAALDLIARRHRDPDFTPDSIAAELHLSRRQLYRLFENTENSLATRIADSRIETAREMLIANPWLPIGNISAASGFRSVATFRNRFKARHGVGPVEYRQRIMS
jgi:AraC family transcriptional activator of tynA and feaB